MASKRNAVEAGVGPTAGAGNKRPKLILTHKRKSSDTPSCSTSEDSVLLSSVASPGEQSTLRSSVSSVEAEDLDSGSESDISSILSDTSEDDCEADDEDDEDAYGEIKMSRTPSEQELLFHQTKSLNTKLKALQNSPKRTKHNTDKILSQAKSLQSRLVAFLPQMQQANAEIGSNDDDNLNMENVPEGEQYIEMNLGLGVLEQKSDLPTVFDSSSDESEDDMEPANQDRGTVTETEHGRTEPESKVMRHLLGLKVPQPNPGIQELDSVTVA